MKDIGLKDIWKEYIYFSKSITEKQLKRIIEKYIFKSTPSKIKYNELITIVEHEKLNEIGNDKFALSEKWFESNPEQIVKLKNNTLNYFQNIIKAKDKNTKCLWITYMEHHEKLKGKGYTKGFYYKNRKKNEYKNKIYLAYLENNFMLRGKKLDGFTQNQYALAHLLHFILNSGIRDGKQITLYIPSSRMRKLLKEWINEQKYEEN